MYKIKLIIWNTYSSAIADIDGLEMKKLLFAKKMIEAGVHSNWKSSFDANVDIKMESYCLMKILLIN
jgi:hypothetical protein